MKNEQQKVGPPKSSRGSAKRGAGRELPGPVEGEHQGGCSFGLEETFLVMAD